MKKLMLAICLIGAFTFSSQAQIDLKINPLGLLFGSPDLAGEYLVSEDLGVELSAGVLFGKVLTSDLNKSGYTIRLSGKYYFNPEDGCDKFYAGIYLGPRSRKTTGDLVDLGTGGSYEPGAKISAFAGGISAGYKWVSDSGVVFELGAGLGRAFGDKITYNDSNNPESINGLGIDGFGILSVGYRIGTN